MNRDAKELFGVELVCLSTVCVSLQESDQSNVMTYGQVNEGDSMSTASHAGDTSCQAAASSVISGRKLTGDRFMMTPYHAITLPPAVDQRSLLGYVDLIASPLNVSPPPSSLFVPQNCLTTKLRAGRCFALAPTKFTPY